jgi:ribosomal protein S18 acetylase RimI-like enzyme
MKVHPGAVPVKQTLPDSGIRFRRPARSDVQNLIALLEQHRIQILSLGDKAFLQAVVLEATAGGQVNIVIAEREGELIGWSIAVVNPKCYWRRFAFRHPTLGFRLLRRRFSRPWRERRTVLTVAEEAEDGAEFRWPHRASVTWGISHESIAKHIDITVLQPFRSAGIGEQLQRAQRESLAHEGVHRVDAVVSRRNLPSIRFHIKHGWALVGTDDERFYITKDLRAEAPGLHDHLQWNRQKVKLPFSLGEIPLFTLRFSGIRSDPNIFEVPEIESIEPPVSEMKKADVRCAYVLSCPIVRPLPRLSLIGGYIRFVSQQYRHHYVRIQKDGFADYLATFNKKTLSTLKRKVARATMSNRVSAVLATYKHPEEMDAFLEDALPISKRSYQRTLLAKGLPESNAFREQLRHEAAAGRVRGYILHAEDTPVAYNLCPIYGDGVLLYDYTGYDPRYSKYSPGTVLQFKIIESLYQEERRLKAYDLCTGEGQHKELFATHQVLCANIYFLPLTPQHLISICSKIALDRATLAAKAFLDRLGLKNKLKKMIRRQWL